MCHRATGTVAVSLLPAVVGSRRAAPLVTLLPLVSAGAASLYFHRGIAGSCSETESNVILLNLTAPTPRTVDPTILSPQLSVPDSDVPGLKGGDLAPLAIGQRLESDSPWSIF